MIWFNGFPFLDKKEEHSFGVPVSAVMIRDLVLLPSVGLKLDEVEAILGETDFGGFPIVQDRDSKVLLGYIGRTELRYAIGTLLPPPSPSTPLSQTFACIDFGDRAKRLRRILPTAKCYFTPPNQTLQRTHTRTPSLPTQIPLDTPLSPPDTLPSPFTTVSSLDFGQYIDFVPLTTHPNLPLETVMEMFKKLGPRVVLVELRGRVCGLVTVKDVLKYQFKVENEENPRTERGGGEERVWGWIEGVGRVLAGVWSRVGRRGGGIRIEHTPRLGSEDEVELVETPR
jgi:chloride channel 3/4/5